MAAAGLLNLSGPSWPPPLPLSLVWPETGPPFLTHFLAWCLSFFPPSDPEVVNLGLLCLSSALLLSFMGVLSDLVFSLMYILLSAHRHLSLGHIFFLLCMVKTSCVHSVLEKVSVPSS